MRCGSGSSSSLLSGGNRPLIFPAANIPRIPDDDDPHDGHYHSGGSFLHCPLAIISIPISVELLLVVLFPCRVSIKILSLSQSQVFASIGVVNERASIFRRCFPHFHLHHALPSQNTSPPCSHCRTVFGGAAASTRAAVLGTLHFV